MSIQKKLISRINETYFKYYQNTDLFVLTLNSAEHELTAYLHELDELGINSILDDLVRDLLFYQYHNYLSNYEVSSKPAKDYEAKKMTMEYSFEDSLSYYEDPLHVAKILGKLSSESYYVGGCVRDGVTGTMPKDFDFVTDAPYYKLEKAFGDAGYKVQSEGKQFLVLIVTKYGEQFEIANFRKDGTYADGRRPESVEIGTINDDAQRRDFTVNAGYVNVVTGALLDPNGDFIDDVYNKTLRFIGKPKDRIQDDYLRVFRAYRFASRGFKMDNVTIKACREHFADATEKTSPERIRMEVEKMAKV